MPSAERDTQLKSYLESILPAGTLEEVADVTETPMRAGSGRRSGNSDQRKAHEAVRKLQMGKEIDDREAMLIEAIIIPERRPAIDIVGGTYSVDHKDWLQYDRNPTFRANIETAIPSVGRIELPDHWSAPFGGTGFIVGDNLIMTNRHVAEIFARGLGEKGLHFISGQSAAIDLLRERDSHQSRFLKVAQVRMIHPYWDMALLEMEEMPADIQPLTLSLREPEDLEGSQIALIGYPAFDPRNNAEVQNTVFNGVYNVKRLLPGLLKTRSVIRSYGSSVESVTHDASSLGGASGSCVLDVTSGEVVALHFAGRYKVANYAVPSYELSRDDNVVGAGVEFGEDGTSNIEDPNPWKVQWTEADASDETVTSDADATTGEPDSASTAHQQNAAVQVTAPTATQAGTCRFTIPLTIDISIGTPVQSALPAQVATAAPAPAADVEKMVEPFHDDDYSHRPGYDPDFVGPSVPMPEPVDTADVSRLDDGGHVLDYYHFSLVVDKTRRMPLITAANVDTRPASLKPDPSKKYGRRDLNGFTSKNDREKWFTDPRIPASHQLPDKFFNKDRKAFDKGHVVRRNAVVWGRTYREIQLANGDTFHATNCTPQVKGFNRSTEGGIWGQLENHVFKQAKTQKLCILAGPVLKDSDPMFSGFDDDGAIRVRIPQAYWKIAAAEVEGDLKVFAFLLEQDLSDVAFEFQVTAKWKEEQIGLSALETELGNVRFAKVLHNADQAETDMGEAVRMTSGLILKA